MLQSKNKQTEKNQKPKNPPNKTKQKNYPKKQTQQKSVSISVSAYKGKTCSFSI